MTNAPEQDHNHNLDISALNYPCHITLLGIIRHSKAKDPGMGSHRGSYYYL
jgi:hypothetical protein